MNEAVSKTINGDYAQNHSLRVRNKLEQTLDVRLPEKENTRNFRNLVKKRANTQAGSPTVYGGDDQTSLGNMFTNGDRELVNSSAFENSEAGTEAMSNRKGF